jgi:SAM-dependent methyltransferase
MTASSEQDLIARQRADWNLVAPGWEKWDHFFDEQLAFVNYRLLGDARIRSGMKVLDLGSGTGHPALLAAQAVGSKGWVIGLDLAEYMVEAAQRKAGRLGLTNVTFQAGDATVLPFENDSFDALTSRFCVMFVPDLPQALSEMARVLKPGGWAALAVWAEPDRNPALSIPIEILRMLVPLPPSDPQAPGIFRLAQPGALAKLMVTSGFAGVEEALLTGEWCYRSPDDYYGSLIDLAAPIRTLLVNLSDSEQAEARRLIREAALAYARADQIVFPFVVRLVSAQKPLRKGQ